MDKRELQEHAGYLVDNLESVLLEYSKQPNNFLNKTILSLSDTFETKKDFILKKSIEQHATINPFNIRGSSHPDYIGLTWKQLIETGRRMHLNIPLLKKNPNYYLENNIKLPQMLFTQVDGDLFVDGDGNHRSALCQLLFYAKSLTSLHGVLLTSYVINHSLYDAYRTLDEERKGFKFSTTLRAYSKPIARDDVGGFMKEQYENIVEITNPKKNISLRLTTPNQVYAFIEEAKNKRFFGFFAKGQFKDFVY